MLPFFRFVSFIVRLPVFGSTITNTTGESSMNTIESGLEIADLEYDVGGTHSIEPGNGDNSNEVVIIYYLPPV
jgi:hypothetical protein